MKKILFAFGLLIFIILISLHFDSEIVKAISSLRSNFLDDFFKGVAFLSREIIIFLFLTVLFLPKRKRKWILPLWVTLGLSAIISFLLKILIQKPRPFQQGIVSILPTLEKVSHSSWNFSFPSSHAMFVFCVLPILSKKSPKLKYIWIFFAALVAFSRVYFGLHFLSDVLAGGLIGYLIGMIIVKLEEEEKFGEKIYRKIFRK